MTSKKPWDHHQPQVNLIMIYGFILKENKLNQN